MEIHFGQIERLHVLVEVTLLDPRFKKPVNVNLTINAIQRRLYQEKLVQLHRQ